MESSDKQIAGNQEAVEFSLKDFVQACLLKWHWFVISIVVCIGIASLYILRQQLEYERAEEILIKDQDAGGGIGDIANAFSSFGLVSNNTSVYNELISLKSPAVMKEVAKRLQLYMNYDKSGFFHPVTLYGKTLPVIVDMQDIEEEGGASFKMELNPNGSMRLWKFKKSTPDGDVKLDGEVTLSSGKTIAKTPLGVVGITPNPDYSGEKIESPIEIEVEKMAMQNTVEYYGEQLNGELVDDYADVIELKIKDVCVERAVDILNTILVVYNENWVADKNKMAVATSAFIDERLRLIQQELGDVDSNIAEYQTKTGTPSLIESAKISMEKDALLDENILDLNNQLAVAKYMKEFLLDGGSKFSIIPVMTVMANTGLENDITTYNTLLLNRNNLVANSSESNPLVADYDAQLKGMRESIIRSVDNQLSTLSGLIKNAMKEKWKTGSRLASTSVKALPLLSEERQQKVKEGLYLFLLQKREENELSQKFTADNVRILTPPMGSLKPVSPKKKVILVLAFFLSIAFPLALIYVLETGNTKVREKKDLEKVKIPFAGEVPQVGKKQKLKVETINDKRSRKDEKPPLAVVEDGKRDVVNEAFRVIRSNIDFMTGKDGGCQTIMLTSFNPGSGKSFISYNLGLSFALKEKRVLLIDCDLRHGSSSLCVGMPSKGLTNYLTDNVDDWRGLVVSSAGNLSISVLPVGKMPPNPAELLENGRLKKLLDEAKGDYDYILLDCPPVNIVVDTQIVGQYADRTLFVVRAGLLERSALSELNEFYEEKKFKNMSLILNGTEAVHSRYYTYGNYQSF